MKKKVLAMLMAACMVMGMTACGSSDGGTKENAADVTGKTENTASESEGDAKAATPEVTLKLGHSLAETLVAHQAMQEFTDSVYEKTNGAVKVDVYANSQLGSERDMVEGMQLGTVDMVYASTSVIANFVPDFSIFDAPFLINSDNVWKVCDGEIGEQLSQELLDTQKIRLIGFTDVGARDIFSTKPVKEMKDFSGLKIRVMENEVHIALFNMLGAQATPMAFSELYTALQQGTVDAGENSLQGITGSGFDDICKYITLTEHIYAVCPLMISDASYAKIPDEYKDIFMEEAKKCVENERKLVAEQNNEALENMKSNGCEIYEIPHEELATAVSGIYEQFSDTFPQELVKKIQEIK